MEEKKAQDVLLSNLSLIPKDKVLYFKEALNRADDECYEKLLQTSLKNPSTVLLLSIFLGWAGVDRFFISDIALGIIKLLFIPIIFLLVFLVALFLDPVWIQFCTLIGMFGYNVFLIIDIFLCYAKVKTKNYKKMMSVLDPTEY
ncbi:MAG: TM2 domain-containing protein [Clostridia bacterium]|nr:TM2 domain-containing protein [Clostridia bacterium]